MCYATHCALDAILDLQATHKLGLQDVASVEVSTSRGALIPLIHPHARSSNCACVSLSLKETDFIN